MEESTPRRLARAGETGARVGLARSPRVRARIDALESPNLVRFQNQERPIVISGEQAGYPAAMTTPPEVAEVENV